MTTSERRYGRGRIELATLSDAELERELRKRRARRGVPTGASASGSAQTKDAQRASADLARHYASLELPIGAPRDEVVRAHARLHAKYEPYARSEDADRRAAAEHLLRALQTARDELLRS